MSISGHHLQRLWLLKSGKLSKSMDWHVTRRKLHKVGFTLPLLQLTVAPELHADRYLFLILDFLQG
jgi:hypothetical protein